VLDAAFQMQKKDDVMGISFYTGIFRFVANFV